MPVDGATFDDARPVLRAVTENVMLEIQKTFDFFKATAASDRDRSHHPERRRVARRGLHRDARRALRGAGRSASIRSSKVAFDAKKFKVESAADIAPTAAVAVGLALRRVGDR